MKKLVVLLVSIALAGIMAFSFTGCDGGTIPEGVLCVENNYIGDVIDELYFSQGGVLFGELLAGSFIVQGETRCFPLDEGVYKIDAYDQTGFYESRYDVDIYSDQTTYIEFD